MNNNKALIMENIHKSYQDGDTQHKVLTGLNLTVEAGEFVAILGPSGSGKSTLLSVAGLLLTQDGGNLRIQETPIEAYRTTK